MKKRKEEDLRRRREEEIKRRREVVGRVWKQPKVTSAAAAEVGEGHRGKVSQSRKFLNLFGGSATQYSATGGCFLPHFTPAVVRLAPHVITSFALHSLLGFPVLQSLFRKHSGVKYVKIYQLLLAAHLLLHFSNQIIISTLKNDI